MNGSINKFRQWGNTTADALHMMRDYLVQRGCTEQEIDEFFHSLLSEL